MLYGAKNGSLAVDGRETDYIAFGRGAKALIVLPGLGDGLRTVKGAALPFAWMYREFAGAYRVYVFSRPKRLEEGCSTEDMADGVKLAVDALGIASASVVGISQGGMIAQYLAIKHPARVEKLVLALTLSRPNQCLRETVGAWISMAERGDHRQIIADTAEKSYSEGYLRRYRRLLHLLGLYGKPKDFSRFIIQAQACLGHEAYGRLGEIQCPTLVLGGSADKIVSPEASVEIAERIAGSELFLYQDLGHGAYEEAGDFKKRVLDFLEK